MYVNGIGFRGIERVTGVHHTTVINWVRQVGEGLPFAYDERDHSRSGGVGWTRNLCRVKKKIWLWTTVTTLRKPDCIARHFVIHALEEMLRQSIGLLLHYLKFWDVPIPQWFMASFSNVASATIQSAESLFCWCPCVMTTDLWTWRTVSEKNSPYRLYNSSL